MELQIAERSFYHYNISQFIVKVMMNISSYSRFRAVLIAVVSVNVVRSSIECAVSGSYGDVVNDQFIVKLAEDKLLNRNINVAFVTEGLLEPFANRAQVMHTYTHAIPGFSVQGLSPIDVARLKNDPRVQYIVPVSVMKLAQSTSIPWNIDRLDQNSSRPDSTYDDGNLGAGVLVFILDSGIRASHTEFLTWNLGDDDNDSNITRVIDGYNAYPDDGWDDIYGHGTAVAAVVGGFDYGVAKNVTLINVKVLGNDGCGTSATVLAGINFVIGIKQINPWLPMVINLSMTGELDDALNDAVTSAFDNGIFVVGAAGNDGGDACQYFPGAVKGVVIAGASQISDYIANFSNTGECVDIYAPGVDILTASNECDECDLFDSGTSYSAAHVSGVAALFLSQYPEDTPLELWERIYNISRKDAMKDLNPVSMSSSNYGSMLGTASDLFPFWMKNSTRKPLLATKK